VRVFIPSKGRPDIISTHLLFKDNPEIDWTVVVHNAEEESYYQMNPTIPSERIVVSGVPYNIATQRNWIQDNLIKENEWYISLDDNIKYFSGIADREMYAVGKYDFDKESKKRLGELALAYNQRIETSRILEIFEEMKVLGQEIGAYNCGFGTTPNFYFRAKKYRTVGYVISKAVVRKKVGLRFNESAFSVEDYCYTAECLKNFGKVLINNYIYPEAEHYQQGGIGTMAERLPYKNVHTKIAMEAYPDMFRIRKRKSSDNKDLAFRFISEKQVEKWRRVQGLIK